MKQPVGVPGQHCGRRLWARSNESPKGHELGGGHQGQVQRLPFLGVGPWIPSRFTERQVPKLREEGPGF